MMKRDSKSYLNGKVVKELAFKLAKLKPKLRTKLLCGPNKQKHRVFPQIFSVGDRKDLCMKTVVLVKWVV